MAKLNTNLNINMTVELDLKDSQLQELFNTLGPDFDQELQARLQRYFQGALIDMIENTETGREFMLAMQLEPNSSNLNHAIMGRSHNR